MSQAQSGSLDISFGTGGMVSTLIQSSAWASSLAIQADGKLVTVGASENGTSINFAVARYNQDGSLDNSFDSDGLVTTAIGAGLSASAHSVAIQSDGKIVVAGTSHNGTYKTFTLVRYNTDGSPDHSFNSTGIVITAIGLKDSEIYAVAIQSDGKIVVAGISRFIKNQFTLARYNIDGSLDNSFDTDGIATTSEGIGNGVLNVKSLVLQTDGKIVVGGTCFSSSVSYPNFVVLRYNSIGSLDSSFDADGIAFTKVGDVNDQLSSLAIQSDGKILLAGYTNEGVQKIALVRYHSVGGLDSSFNDDGIVTTAIEFKNASSHAMALQADGKIIVAGKSAGGFTIMRYNINGNPDSSFDADGIVTTQIKSNLDHAKAVVIQSDGKIVAAGYCMPTFGYSSFALARYNTEPTKVSTANKKGIEINIYPNPFAGMTTLYAGEPLYNATLTIHNCYGQVLRKIEHISGQAIVVKRDDLPSGMYILRLSQDSNIITTNKLVIID